MVTSQLLRPADPIVYNEKQALHSHLKVTFCQAQIVFVRKIFIFDHYSNQMLLHTINTNYKNNCAEFGTEQI